MKKPAFDQPLARFTTVKKRYDSLGRMVEEKLQVGSSGAWRIVSHDMRSVDVADAIYPGGRQVDYAYWQNRALASVKDHGAGSDIADYDYIGSRVLKRTMQNGVNLDFENGSGTYYDSLGRPTTWKHVKSGTMKIGFDLTYDRAGNPTAISLLHDTAKGSFSSIGYDSANRLLSSTHAGAWSGQPLAEHWTLDGVGNMKYVDGYTTGSRLTTSFNEYYSVAGVTNTQDDNGNLTSDGTLTYKWDGFNRLSEVKNGGTTVADYTYDAEGRRVAKIVSGTTTCYSLDGWREIAEYTGTGASNPDRELIFGSFIDEPLVLDSNDSFDSSCTGTGDNRYYYHQNWQYSVCALTNGSGTIVEGYEYEPYGHHRVFYHSGSAVGFTSGDTISDLGSSHYGNPLLYTGRRFDSETGLLDLRMRYYSQACQRFLSRDSIPVSSGYVNKYQYVSGRPLSALDYSGLIEWELGGGFENFKFDDEDNGDFHSVEPTAMDRMNWLLAYTAAHFYRDPPLGDTPNNHAAADGMLYFLTFGAEGRKDFSGDVMIAEDDFARSFVLTDIEAAVLLARQNPDYLGHMVGHQKLGNPEGDTSSPKWHPAIGGFFLKGGAQLTWKSEGCRLLNINIQIGDFYNWDDINKGSISPFADYNFRRLYLAGLAMTYERDGGNVNLHLEVGKDFIPRAVIERRLLESIYAKYDDMLPWE